MVRFQSIEESLRKIKDLAFLLRKGEVYWACGLILLALSAYFAGSLSFFHAQQLPIVLEQCTMTVLPTPVAEIRASKPTPAGIKEKGTYVGSKSSKKYHLATCASAHQIKDSNRVYFSSKEEAQLQGYVPAGNCKM